MNFRPLFVLSLSLLASCAHSASPGPEVVTAPRLFIEGIDVDDPAGAKPLPAGSALRPGQGFAVRLRGLGFIQVVEELADGAASFLDQANPAAPARIGRGRIPATGFLHSSAAAHTVCLVASGKPLLQPSCAEYDGRGEDRAPPAAPTPKESKPPPPPPPTRDDNKTRSPETIRVVRKIPVAS